MKNTLAVAAVSVAVLLAGGGVALAETGTTSPPATVSTRLAASAPTATTAAGPAPSATAPATPQPPLSAAQKASVDSKIDALVADAVALKAKVDAATTRAQLKELRPTLRQLRSDARQLRKELRGDLRAARKAKAASQQ